MDDDELERLLGVVSTPKENRKTRRARLRQELELEREKELGSHTPSNTQTDIRPEEFSSSAETKVDHQPAVHSKLEDPIIIERDFAPTSVTAPAPLSSEPTQLLPPTTIPILSDSQSSVGKPSSFSVTNQYYDHDTYSGHVSTTQPQQPLASDLGLPTSRDDLAHRMLQSMLDSLSVNQPSAQSLGKAIVATSSADDGTQNVEDVELKNESKSGIPRETGDTTLVDIKPPKDYQIIAVNTRLPGSKTRRIGYKIVRTTNEGYNADNEEGMDTDNTDVEPDLAAEPPTPAQRYIRDTYAPDVLTMIDDMAQVDNTHGYQLPTLFHELFATLSDHSKTIMISNHLRQRLDLPPLSTKTKRVALHRTIAKMRLDLYTELVSALVLPLAPLPLPSTDDEEEREKEERITLTPSSLKYMAGVLPDAFPKEKYSIKRFLADPDGPYGERKGLVHWTAGIGQLIGGDPYGPGFRGDIKDDGLVCVFVD